MIKLNKILIVGFILSFGYVSAQDFPYHYFLNFNPLVNNPSYASLDNDLRIDVGMYSLWAGDFKPLNDYMISFSVSPDIKKKTHRNEYEPKVGLGAIFLRERIGPFSQNIFQMIYSYHIPLDRYLFLSLGVSGSFESLGIDVNSLTPLNPDDPRLLTGNNNSFLIDGAFGASLHNEKYTISFSAINLASGDFQFKDSSAKKIANFRKYYFLANYDFELSRNILFRPSFDLRNSRVNNFNFDASANFDFTFLNIGLGYRSENSVFLFTKIPYKNFFFVYNSENPLRSNHMLGRGHTFSVGWVLAK